MNETCAVSEAGITILPPPHDAAEEGTVEDADILQNDSVTLKWPRKTGISEADFFESDDSWFDAPPEGFSLTVSLVKILETFKPVLFFSIFYGITLNLCFFFSFFF